MVVVVTGGYGRGGGVAARRRSIPVENV